MTVQKQYDLRNSEYELLNTLLSIRNISTETATAEQMISVLKEEALRAEDIQQSYIILQILTQIELYRSSPGT